MGDHKEFLDKAKLYGKRALVVVLSLVLVFNYSSIAAAIEGVVEAIQEQVVEDNPATEVPEEQTTDDSGQVTNEVTVEPQDVQLNFRADNVTFYTTDGQYIGGSLNVSPSNDFSFTASANDGYENLSVSLDGAQLSGDGYYTIYATQLYSGATVSGTASAIPEVEAETVPAAESIESAETQDEVEGSETEGAGEESATTDAAETGDAQTGEATTEPAATTESAETGDAADADDATTEPAATTDAAEEAAEVIDAGEVDVTADVSKPAFEGYAYVSYNGRTVVVKVTAAEGALPEGTQVVATLKTSGAAVKAAESIATADGSVVEDSFVIDVTLQKDGKEIQPEAPVNVCFFNTGLEGESIGVYRVSDDATSVETIASPRQTDGECVSFDTDHFTDYALVATTAASTVFPGELVETYNLKLDSNDKTRTAKGGPNEGSNWGYTHNWSVYDSSWNSVDGALTLSNNRNSGKTYDVTPTKAGTYYLVHSYSRYGTTQYDYWVFNVEGDETSETEESYDEEINLTVGETNSQYDNGNLGGWGVTHTWTNSDVNIAAADSYGRITGVSTGTTYVKCSYKTWEADKNGQWSEVTKNVTIKVNVTEGESEYTKILIVGVGETIQVAGADHTQYGNWLKWNHTSNISGSGQIYQFLDENGNEVAEATHSDTVTIIGKAEGTGTFVHQLAGAKTENYLIIVVPAGTANNGDSSKDDSDSKATTSLTVDPKTAEMVVGATQQLTATTEPANAEVTWTSSDTNVATVDANGKVTAVGVGTATITATSGELFDTATITVTRDTSKDTEQGAYFYLAVPGISSPSQADHSHWLYAGEGKVNAPKISNGAAYTDNVGSMVVSAGTYYQDKTYTYNGKTYRYDAEGTGADGTFTVVWDKISQASGANNSHQWDGENKKDTTVVGSGTSTWHVDGHMILNDAEYATVSYYVQQPGSSTPALTTWGENPNADEGATALIDNKTALKDIRKPKVDETKKVKGVTYTFDGWYADASFTTKVDLNSSEALGSNRDFYARYIVKSFDYTVEGYSGTYDGQAHTLSKVEVPAGASVKYSTDGGKTWSTEQPQVTDVNDSTQVTVLIMVDGISQQVSANLTVTPREYSVVTAGKEWTYDGTEHTLDEVTVSGLVEGETIGTKATGAITNVGETDNTYDLTWAADGNNYTAKKSNYKASGSDTLGTLKVVKAEFKVEAQDYTGIYDGQAHGITVAAPEDATVTYEGTNSFTDVTDGSVTVNFTVTRPNYEDFSGSAKVTITPKEYSVTTEGQTWTYDGTEHKLDKVTVTGLVGDETVVAHATGSITNVGSVANDYTLAWAEDAGVFDGITGSAATAKKSNYMLAGEIIGELKVEAQAISESSVPEVNDTNSFVYDGQEHKWVPTVTIEGENGTTTMLTENTDYKVTYSTSVTGDGEFKDVESITVTITGIGNYSGEVTRTYSITPAPVTITTESASKIYDGSALTASGEMTGLVEGEEVSFTVTGSQTVVGGSSNTYKLKWDKSAKQSNYSVTESLGTLTVTAQSFVDTDDGYKGLTVEGLENVTYDGKEHKQTPVVKAKDAEGNDITLIEGVDYDLSYSTTATGTTEFIDVETVTVTITGKGNYTGVVTKTYDITPAQLSIVTQSASAVYDGETVLTAKSETGSELSGLVNGEAANVNVTGKQSEVGSSANSVTVSFADKAYTFSYDENGVTVSEGNSSFGTVSAKSTNYTFATKEIGTLTVTDSEEEIVVTVAGGSYTYDGAEHKATVTVSDLPKGYTLEKAESTASVTNVSDGVKTAEVNTLIIKNAQGEDVTSKLNITYAGDGKLEITPAALTVTTDSMTWVADGQEHSLGDDSVRVTGLVGEETVGAKATGKVAATAGSSAENTAELEWANAGVLGIGGNSYTAAESNYTVTYELGTLKVVNAADLGYNLNISTNSWVYDGTFHSEYFSTGLATATTPGATNTGVVAELTYSADGGETFTATEPVDAGNYIVKATWKAADVAEGIHAGHYGEYSATAEFSITQRELSVTASQSVDYNDAVQYLYFPTSTIGAEGNAEVAGKTSAGADYRVQGLVSGETLELTGASISGKAMNTSFTEVSSYTWAVSKADTSAGAAATATVNSTNNYKITVSGTLTIGEPKVEPRNLYLFVRVNTNGGTFTNNAANKWTKGDGSWYTVGYAENVNLPAPYTSIYPDGRVQPSLFDDAKAAVNSNSVVPFQVGSSTNGWFFDADLLNSVSWYNIANAGDTPTGYPSGSSHKGPQWRMHGTLDFSTSVSIDSSWIYDGTTAAEGHNLTSTISGGNFEDEPVYTYYKVNGTTTTPLDGAPSDAGTYTVTATYYLKGTDHKAYVTSDATTFTITQREVTVTAGTPAPKAYDGKALTDDSWTVAEATDTTGLVGTDAIGSVTVTGSQVYVGTSANVPSDAVFASGNADNYHVNYVPGTLEVTSRSATQKYEINLKAKSATATYDGQFHSATGIENTTFEFDGKTYTVSGLETTGAIDQRNAGTYTSVITGTPVVKDEAGEDVTSEFVINKETGTLTINKRKVIVQSASDSKTYDGTALVRNKQSDVTDISTLNGATNTSDRGWVGNDGAQYVFTNEGITDAGSVSNTFKVERGKEGTILDNYDIICLPGKLTVNACTDEVTVKIAGNNGSAIYDGVAHSANGYTVTSISNNLYDASSITFSGSSTLSATNAGTYAMGLKPENFASTSKNFTNVKFEVTDGSLTIAKRQVKLTSATDSKIYNGTALVNHNVTETCVNVATGSAFVGEEGLDYSNFASITNAGETKNTFTYAAKEGTDLNNYEITVDEGTLTVNAVTTPVVVTITGNNGGEKYNGSEQSVNGYSVSISDELYTSAYFTAPAQDAEVATVTGTNAGSYSMALASDDFENTSSNFTNVTFAVTPGTLTIAKRDVTLTTATDSKTYDGKALTNENVNVSGDGFVAGEGATYDVTGTQTAPGASVNYFGSADDATDGYTLNSGTSADNYNITLAEGTLTVTNRADDEKFNITLVGNSSTDNTYDGTAKSATGVETDTFTIDGVTYTVSGYVTSDPSEANAGTYYNNVTGDFKVTDADGTDVTSEFSIATEAGTLAIAKRDVTLTSASESRAYNGQALTNSTVTAEGFVAGEGATYQVTGSQTNVGSSKNAFSYTFDENTLESNYNITKTEGDLEVTALADEVVVTVAENSNTVTYNGEEQKAEGYTVTNISNSLYTTGDFTFSGEAEVAGTNAGTYEMQLAAGDFANVSSNFSNVRFVVEDGALTINKRAVTLTSANDSKTYDGSALTNNTVTVSGDGFVAGESATYDVTGTQTNAGTSDNEFAYTLTGGATEGEDGNYTITKVEGKLTVNPVTTKVVVTVTGNTDTVTYNAAEHTVEGYETNISNDLYTADDFEFTGTAEVKGTNANTYEMGLKPADFTNTSSNFTDVEFVVTDGSLTINKRDVTLTSASDSREYNGAALTNHNVTVSGDGFVAGQGADYSFTGSRTLVGTSENTFTYALTGGASEDNYNITTEYGSLTITNRDAKYAITLVAKSSTDGTYDGTNHAVKGVEETTFTFDGVEYTVSGFETSDPSETDAGEYTNAITTPNGSYVVKNAAGDDVSDQFAVTPENGKLVIAQRAITVAAGTSTGNVYTPGITYSVKAGLVDDTTLATGQELSYQLSYDGVTADTCSSAVVCDYNPVKVASVVITDANGTDVTKNYNVTTKDGRLQVVKPEVANVKASVAIDSWVYDGTNAESSHNLTATADSAADNAELSYSYEQQVDGEWEAFEGIPSDAGTYRVTATWAASANYPSVSASTEFTVSKATITVTTNGASKVYDGVALTNAENSVDGLAPGETLGVTNTGTITNVGSVDNTYELTWAGAGSAYTAKEANYTVAEPTLGKLVVSAKDLGTLSVNTPSDTIYNGAEQAWVPTVTNGDTTLVEGNDYEVAYSEDVTNVGTVTVTITGKGNYEGTVERTYQITKAPLTITTGSLTKTYDGSALTAEGSIEGFVAGETADFAVTGAQTNVGTSTNTYSLEWNGTAKETNYSVTENLGTLTVVQAAADDLKAQVSADGWTYDGTFHEENIASESDSSAVVVYTYTDAEGNEVAEPTAAGTYTVTATWPANNNYPELSVSATFTIAKRTVTLTSASDTKVFDGEPLTNDEVKIEGSFVEADGITYEATGSQTTVGETPNTIEVTGAEETLANYDVIKHEGTLEVTPADFTVEAEGYTGIYDGQAHGITVTAPEDAEITYDVENSFTDVTDGAVEVTYTVKRANYTDVTGSATVTITPATITVSTGSATKVYDGTALTEVGNTVEGLVAGETLGITNTGSQTEVGTSANTYELAWAADGNEYTAKQSNYTVVEAEIGTLEVTPAPVVPDTTNGDGTPADTNTPGAGDNLPTPLDAVVNALEDVAQPMVDAVEGTAEETIDDEGNPLAGTEHRHCWIHFYIICGMVLTAIYGTGVVTRRTRFGKKVQGYIDNFGQEA